MLYQFMFHDQPQERNEFEQSIKRRKYEQPTWEGYVYAQRYRALNIWMVWIS